MGAIALLCCVAFGAGAPEALQWPLDLPREVTSSFGEYRPGRFHAGIDLRTGEVGKPVHAAADGHVSRVRCSPFGYGKAVYLTLADGSTVVYGHLSDYRDDLRAYVRAAQHKAENYTVDLTPKPGEFAVKRGEIIALSGDTGIGVPHLHWEIRDKAGHLVNPRTLGITWPDDTRPLLEQLLVWPVDGSVNGDIVPQAFPLKALGNGQYSVAPIKVSGAFAVGIETTDPEKGGAKLGIHDATVRIGGEDLFTVRNDVLDYDTNDSAAVAFCMPVSDRGRFLTLWRWPGNDTPSYRITKGNGISEGLTGAANAEIVVADFAGNSATLSISLSTGTLPPGKPGKPGVGRGNFEAQAWGDYMTITARFDQPEGEFPSGEAVFAKSATPLEFLRVGPKTYRARFAPAQAGEYVLRAQHPRASAYESHVTVCKNSAQAATVGNTECTVTTGATAPYGTLFLAVDEELNPKPDAIRRAGKVWNVGPPSQPLKEEISISMPIPDDVGQLARAGIYRNSGSGWSFLGNTRAGNPYTAKTSRLGSFAVLEDNVPPVIGSIVAGGKDAKPSRRPSLRARISDIGSGIETFAIHCGDTWLLTAYDPEKAIIRWEQDEDLPSGPQTVTFSTTDAAGNETKQSREIVVP